MRTPHRFAIVFFVAWLAGCGSDKLTEAEVEEFLQEFAATGDSFDQKASCAQFTDDAYLEATGPDENGEEMTLRYSRDDLCRGAGSAMSAWKQMGAESHSTMTPSVIRIIDDGQSAAVAGSYSQTLRLDGESTTAHTRFEGMVVLRDGEILVSNWLSKQM